MTSIPTSTSVTESALIPAHISQVWRKLHPFPCQSIETLHQTQLTLPKDLIKLPTFHHWLSALKSAEENKGTSSETDIIRWTFKDGTVQDVKQEEHSTIHHYITYSVITSEPHLSYTSVLSTIRCFEITSGEHAGGTFVQWTGNFSSDADAGKYSSWSMISSANYNV